jgi:hypothetical protein
MYLAVQELAQRTTIVRALASVATSRSPARTPVMSHALAARTGSRARNPVRLEYTIGAATTRSPSRQCPAAIIRATISRTWPAVTSVASSAGLADLIRLAATGADRRALTGLVTDERNQEELADRVVAVTTVTGKYLDSQRLRFVSSDDGSRTWRGRSRRPLSAPGRTGCWWSATATSWSTAGAGSAAPD